MSGVVGSTPSFTRSGRPFASWRSSSPSGSASTAFRVRNRVAPPGEFVMRPMLGFSPSPAPVQPSPGAVVMPEPPTPIIHPTATRADRFGRTNGVPETHERKNESGPPGRKPKLKKLRLALVLTGLSALAVVSTVFGMLMAGGGDPAGPEKPGPFRTAEKT